MCDNDERIERQSHQAIYLSSGPIIDNAALQEVHTWEVEPDAKLNDTKSPEHQIFVVIDDGRHQTQTGERHGHFQDVRRAEDVRRAAKCGK